MPNGPFSALAALLAAAASLLSEADGVGRVERLVAVDRPARRIVHIADFHAVALEDLAADLRDQDPDVTDAEIEAEHRLIMAAVERVQRSQRKLIRRLADWHGARVVHVEGLTDADLPAYLALVRALAKHGPDAVPAQFGAVGQALAAGEIDAVAPVEDEAAYQQADPLAGDGVAFEGAANDAREAAIVRRLAASGPLSVVVLGGAHDLSRHVRALGDCEYVRVFVEGWPE